ncbi:hypothetical protein VTI74DRAFT_7289 [Chaetomium olivicolor]
MGRANPIKLPSGGVWMVRKGETIVLLFVKLQASVRRICILRQVRQVATKWVRPNSVHSHFATCPVNERVCCLLFPLLPPSPRHSHGEGAASVMHLSNHGAIRSFSTDIGWLNSSRPVRPLHARRADSVRLLGCCPCRQFCSASSSPSRRSL